MKRSLVCQRARDARGQTLLMFAVYVVVLVLFVGLAIDFGFAYITKAQLSKALDAAALQGVLNLSQGDTQSKAVVSSVFHMNYGSPGRDAVPVTLNVPNPGPCASDPNKNCFTISATATINTFFIRILPQWRTLTVSASAEARRGKAILGLVLDRSGSMNNNGGAAMLPTAVKAFIDLFDDNVDKAALISYATTVAVNVPMEQPFKNDIKTKVDGLSYAGATFAGGGLSAGSAQLPQQDTPDHAIRAAVFFTDGLTNVVDGSLPWCVNSTALNFGGLDSTTGVGFFDPTTGTCVGAKNQSIQDCPAPNTCPGTTTFVSQKYGSARTLNRANVTEDAQFRGLTTAQSMQAHGIVVYSIGLGSTPDEAWLKQVANDQTSGSYNPALPMGKYVHAVTAADLQKAFQTVGADILARLSR